MEEISKLIDFLDEKYIKLKNDSRDVNKEKAKVINNINKLKEQYNNLYALNESYEIINKIGKLITLIMSVYICQTIMFETLNNTLLTVLSSPFVYLSSSGVINTVIDNMLYRLNGYTLKSLPIELEKLNNTITDCNNKIEELDVIMDKQYELYNHLKDIEKQILDYKDDNEVEVEFYDIKEEDNVISFNKYLKLIKDDRKDDN